MPSCKEIGCWSIWKVWDEFGPENRFFTFWWNSFKKSALNIYCDVCFDAWLNRDFNSVSRRRIISGQFPMSLRPMKVLNGPKWPRRRSWLPWADKHHHSLCSGSRSVGWWIETASTFTTRTVQATEMKKKKKKNLHTLQKPQQELNTVKYVKDRVQVCRSLSAPEIKKTTPKYSQCHIFKCLTSSCLCLDNPHAPGLRL